MNRIQLLCVAILLAAVLMVGPVPAFAHDEDMTDAILTGVGIDYGIAVTHVDDDPYKGWFNLTVLNNSGEAWGDFHFQLFEVANGSSLFDVYFSDEQTANSTTGAEGLISSDGNSLDFYFYDNPVLDGQYASFNVYTDNTAGMGNFGISFYATPVPIPGAAILLFSGLATMLGLRRRGIA